MPGESTESPEGPNEAWEVPMIAVWGRLRFDRCPHPDVKTSVSSAPGTLVLSAVVTNTCRTCAAIQVLTWTREDHGKETF
jgi:hypothetical protein